MKPIPTYDTTGSTVFEGAAIKSADMPGIIADAERRVRLAAGSENTPVRVVAGSGVVLADRVAELEAIVRGLRLAVDGLLPFVDEDFPNGPQDETACITTRYQEAYRAAIEAITAASKP